jgi:hypothetical protein
MGEQLSEAVQKDIKAHEESRDANLKKLQEYFGLAEMPSIEVSNDFWQKLNAAIPESYRDRAGWVAYSAILGGLHEGLPQAWTRGYRKAVNCRSAFAEAWKTKKIKITLDGKDFPNTLYHRVLLQDGVLVVQTSPRGCITNVDDIGSDVMDTVSIPAPQLGGIDWRFQYSLDNNIRKITSLVQQLKDMLGSEVTYDIKWEPLAKDLAKVQGGDKLQFATPELLLYSLEGLTGQVIPRMNDDKRKAALKAKWTTGVIKIEVDANAPKKYGVEYHAIDFVNGDLVVKIARPANMDEVGHDVLKRLGL